MNIKIKCEMYYKTVHVFLNKTLEECKTEYEKKYNCINDTDLSRFGAITLFPISNKHYDTVIILIPDNDKTLGYIHHEIVHAATWILHEVGVEISFKNDESLAYLSSYLFNKVINKIIDWKTKTNKDGSTD